VLGDVLCSLVQQQHRYHQKRQKNHHRQPEGHTYDQHEEYRDLGTYVRFNMCELFATNIAPQGRVSYKRCSMKNTTTWCVCMLEDV
jgi:hypothetical protein